MGFWPVSAAAVVTCWLSWVNMFWTRTLSLPASLVRASAIAVVRCRALSPMGLGWAMPTAPRPSGISSLSIQAGALRVVVVVTGAVAGPLAPQPTRASRVEVTKSTGIGRMVPPGGWLERRCRSRRGAPEGVRAFTGPGAWADGRPEGLAGAGNRPPPRWVLVAPEVPGPGAGDRRVRVAG